ncbi:MULTISPECIES: hypothetical protein [Aeromonas]|jgi:hypothetical protein|uniref:hypothetical protein n=1 Tax=Aeromonas TaxID=642 RepID=UPI0005370A8D|nr:MULTISPECIES: hypothetical protein [Aeromonas]MDX7596201.1 hypothetical protein [Aeromonas caviae]PNO60492.1 hypothetical protein MC65_020380 [Aeromonas caviae]
MRQPPWGDLIMAAVITRHTEPTIKAASAYLVRRGYINCGTTWLRGRNGYARMERLTSGAIRIIEGVA